MIVSIPLYVILFIYLAYAFVLSLFSFVNFRHLHHNGALTFLSLSITFLVICLVASTIFFTFVLLSGVDWKLPLVLWNSDWISNTLNSVNF